MLETSSAALPHCFSYISLLLMKSKVIYTKEILFLGFFSQLFSFSCARYFLCFRCQTFSWEKIQKFSPLLSDRLKQPFMSSSIVPMQNYILGVFYFLSSLNEDKHHLDFAFYCRSYQWLCLLSSFSFLSSLNLTFFPVRDLISVFISVWAGFPQ